MQPRPLRTDHVRTSAPKLAETTPTAYNDGCVGASCTQVIFDTALFHSGCPAEDPTGVTGHGADHLLRAVFIMGMTPTRLKTPKELHARRMAYELDFEWYVGRGPA